MRFIFKTDYNQDVKLAKHGGHVFWYSLLGLFLVTAPWVVPEYWLAQLTFVLIYAVVGLGLMLLAGFTGLFSLGHAAFLGVGAYTQAVMVNAGVPFPLALVCAGLFSAIAGVIVGLPALRVKGIYLGMATLAFGFIVEEGMARWESVTGGNAGLMVTYPRLGSWTLDSTEEFYFLCLVITIGATLLGANCAALAQAAGGAGRLQRCWRRSGAPRSAAPSTSTRSSRRSSSGIIPSCAASPCSSVGKCAGTQSRITPRPASWAASTK